MTDAELTNTLTVMLEKNSRRALITKAAVMFRDQHIYNPRFSVGEITGKMSLTFELEDKSTRTIMED